MEEELCLGLAAAPDRSPQAVILVGFQWRLSLLWGWFIISDNPFFTINSNISVQSHELLGNMRLRALHRTLIQGVQCNRYLLL